MEISGKVHGKNFDSNKSPFKNNPMGVGMLEKSAHKSNSKSFGADAFMMPNNSPLIPGENIQGDVANKIA